jgi:glycosyltransferase involved in cell wall biosynthesis
MSSPVQHRLARPLRVLVLPLDLGLGGSINAVELAIAVRKRGHDVTVAAPPGPLVDRLQQADTPYVPVTAPSFKKARESIRQVRAIAERGVDVIHAYEAVWMTLVWYGVHLPRQTPVVGTVNSMSVGGWVPSRVPLRVCNPVIVAQQPKRRVDVGVLEIPTDTTYNSPEIDATNFRRQYFLARDDIVLGLVGRLHPQLKLEGVLSAVRAAAELASTFPIKLVIVGDGPSWADVAAATAQANSRCGREVVIMTGAMNDPRPAYAAADIGLGMGGSLLRAMAMRKPVVVQGELGFWQALSPETAGRFRWSGFFGVGDGQDGSQALIEELTPLLADPCLRERRAELSLALVNAYYRLDAAAEQQEEIYYRALAHNCRRGREYADGLFSALRLGAWGCRRQWDALRGGVRDEWNSLELIAAGLRKDIPAEYLAPWYPCSPSDPALAGGSSARSLT